MGRLGFGVLAVLVMAAVIVAVDVLFFRGQFWWRLAATIGVATGVRWPWRSCGTPETSHTRARSPVSEAMALPPKQFRLVGPDGLEYWSEVPGKLGGHRRNKLYGRLDCRTALWWLARGHIVKHRVFFKDERTAIAAGFRPCAVCMPAEYRAWKEAQPSR